MFDHRETHQTLEHLSFSQLTLNEESQGFNPGSVNMFAEDMNLLPKGQFLNGLTSLRGQLEGFQDLIGELWQKMALGGYSAFLRAKVLHFNGGLFEDVEVLPVTTEQLELLIEAAQCDWSKVEPSIFGTLVERALSPDERHRLGAHYTPRAYWEACALLPHLSRPHSPPHMAALRGEGHEGLAFRPAT